MVSALNIGGGSFSRRQINCSIRRQIIVIRSQTDLSEARTLPRKGGSPGKLLNAIFWRGVQSFSLGWSKSTTVTSNTRSPCMAWTVGVRGGRAHVRSSFITRGVADNAPSMVGIARQVIVAASDGREGVRATEHCREIVSRATTRPARSVPMLLPN